MPDKIDLYLIDRLVQPLVIRDESVMVSITGDLRRSSAPLVRLHLRSLACAGGPHKIVIDLAGVTWIDLEGVEPLMEAHRFQFFRGAELCLSGISAPVARFFRAHPRVARTLSPNCDPGSLIGPAAGEKPLMADTYGSERPTVADGAGSWSDGDGQPDADGGQLSVQAMRAEIEQLREAVASRDVIGQAKGVVSVLYGCDEAAAFAVLCRISQNTNRKLRDVAVILARAAAHEGRLPMDVAAQMGTRTDQGSGHGER